MALLPEPGDNGHSFLAVPCPTGMGHSPLATSRNPSRPPLGPGLLPRCARSLSGERPRWDCAAPHGSWEMGGQRQPWHRWGEAGRQHCLHGRDPSPAALQ